MAEDQANKSAVTAGKTEEEDMATTTTTTTSYHHLLAERENGTLTEAQSTKDQSWCEWVHLSVL